MGVDKTTARLMPQVRQLMSQAKKQGLCTRNKFYRLVEDALIILQVLTIRNSRGKVFDEPKNKKLLVRAIIGECVCLFFLSTA